MKTAHYGLPNILPAIPDNRPGSIPLPTESSQGARTSKGDRGEPKERQRAKSGGSPGATPRRSGQAASTTTADLRESSRDNPEVTEPARQVKIEGDGSEATREAGRQCRRARGETSPSQVGPASQDIWGRGRRAWGGRAHVTLQGGDAIDTPEDRSMGRAGPRIRPRDDDVGGHPADSPPGSRQRMSGHAVGWFLRNMERAFKCEHGRWTIESRLRDVKS